jgi:hypothetical protein
MALRLLHAAGDAPDWVRQAMAGPAPSYPVKVPSVVLLQEEAVTVDTDGRRVMRERGAIRVLQPGGNSLSASRAYYVKNDRVRDFQGWLIPPAGKPTVYSKTSIVDRALAREEVYDDTRMKLLEFGNPAPGSVVAWEITEEERGIFTQDGYGFQGRLPVLLSRYTLTLPPGWEAKGVLFNADPQQAQVSGNTYTWEMRNLPFREREEYSPRLSALVPRLAVSYFPPTDNRAGLQGLKDWTAVSAWLSGLVEPAADVTDAIREKAQQLSASASSELDRIRAIAAFTQQTKYVEISLNATRGGGYTPHLAKDTLARNYGDCKDKATLMRALLKAIGIDSYLITITADDRQYVRPEWASPTQFNHAIVAVHVSDAVSLPTVLPDTPLGRLLIFDPTDPITPVGDLPEDEQGSHALVIAGARGALLVMPQLPASASRIESSAVGTLDAEGRLAARIDRRYFGQSAIPLRGAQTYLGNDVIQKALEREFARRVGATNLSNIAMTAHPEANWVSLNLDLGAERFGQNMQGRLYVVRPGLLASGGEYFLPAKERSAPVKLESDLRRDSIRIQIPAGYQVDELPAPVRIENAYGSLEASWAVENGEIIMKQTLEIRQRVAPAAEYRQVREFFDRLTGAETAPIVFVKR